MTCISYPFITNQLKIILSCPFKTLFIYKKSISSNRRLNANNCKNYKNFDIN